MSVKAGSFSVGSTTNVSVSGLSFLPTEIEIRIGSSVSAVDTSKIARCDGWATAANSSYDSIFVDPTGTEQVAGTGQLIRLRKRVGGVMQDAVAATLVSFDTNVPGVDYGFTLNFTAADVNKQIRYKARD